MTILNTQLGLKICTALFLGVLPLSVAVKPAAAIVPQSTPTNIVTNGSFENPKLNNGGWGLFNSIEGWNVLEGSQGNIEVQNNAAGKAFDGNQLVELDSTGVSGIFQNLATVIGQTYKLEFAFSPRPGVAENTLNVKWGDKLVDTLTANGASLGETMWKTFTYNLVATSTTTRLSFDNFGEKSDSLGTYIDKVSVSAAQSVPEPASVVGLMAFGAIGAGSLRKRKQLEKATAKA
jgi:Protein of unknown function (DUF642)/PEP-CTERM motif